MKIGAMLALTTIALLFATSADADLFGKKKDVDKERQEVIEVREKTLARLYKEKPAAEAMVKDSVGYAVFSNTGINLLLVSTANGKGISHDNESGDDVFMKMFSAGGGLGLGVKKFSAVFIFHNRDAFDQFVEKGWNFTAQADAAATTDEGKEGQPGATEATIGLTAGVTVYQMTEKGLALQATLQGTKYWKDEDLNSD